MEDTKKRILERAKRLFTERGYNEVSVADIADALGISKGNLTYHFKKKEDIMGAILDTMEPQELKEIPDTLSALDRYFRHLQSVTEENVFYFRNHTQLAGISERQRQKQARAFQIHQGLMGKAWKNLRQRGLIQDEAVSGQYDGLSEMLFMMSVYWQPFQSVRAGEGMEYHVQAWLLLFPLLTDKGRDEYEKMRKESSVNGRE